RVGAVGVERGDVGGGSGSVEGERELAVVQVERVNGRGGGDADLAGGERAVDDVDRRSSAAVDDVAADAGVGGGAGSIADRENADRRGRLRGRGLLGERDVVVDD